MAYIDVDNFAERIKLSPAFKKYGIEGDLLQKVVLDLLDNAPAADVEEVKHGEWERIIRNGKPRGIKCSLCGKHIHFHENFCPECGAKMDGERE